MFGKNKLSPYIRNRPPVYVYIGGVGAHFFGLWSCQMLTQVIRRRYFLSRGWQYSFSCLLICLSNRVTGSQTRPPLRSLAAPAFKSNHLLSTYTPPTCQDLSNILSDHAREKIHILSVVCGCFWVAVLHINEMQHFIAVRLSFNLF